MGTQTLRVCIRQYINLRQGVLSLFTGFVNSICKSSKISDYKRLNPSKWVSNDASEIKFHFAWTDQQVLTESWEFS